MGEFFDESNTNKPEEKSNTEFEDLPLMEESWNVDKIVARRNKLVTEVNTTLTPIRERIGQLNLDLFGSDEAPDDFESKIEQLKNVILVTLVKGDTEIFENISLEEIFETN